MDLRQGPARPADLKVAARVTLEDIVSGAKVKIRFPDGRAMAVKLPDYVEDGQVIRLKGQGAAGPGHTRGDALVTLNIAPHPRFRVEQSIRFFLKWGLPVGVLAIMVV